MQFFDTNILIYTLDPAEPVRQPIALQLVRQALQGRTMAISTQVVLEFYNTALRRRLMTPALAVQLLQEWAGNEVVNSTPDLLWRAFELQQRLQLSVWDALIVQAALDAGCTTLYSEDMQHGMQITGLTIVNPFVAPAAVHEPPAAYGATAALRTRRKSGPQRTRA